MVGGSWGTGEADVVEDTAVSSGNGAKTQMDYRGGPCGSINGSKYIAYYLAIMILFSLEINGPSE